MANNSSENGDTQTDEYDSSGDNWPDEQKRVYRIVVPCLVFCCVIAFCFNAYILSLTPLLKKRFSNIIIITLSLAAADCWSSVVIGAGLIMNSYLLSVLEINFKYQRCVIQLMEAFRLGGMLTSVLHLLWLALSHYVAIVNSMSGNSGLSRRTVYMLLAGSWTVPTLFFLGYMVGSGILFGSAVPETELIVCDISWLLFYEIRCVFVALIFIPLVIMAALYVKMMVRLNHIEKQVAHTRTGTKRIARKRSALITTLCMIGTFLVAWLPGSIMYILTALPWNVLLGHKRLTLIFGILSLSCVVFKFLFDPLIYSTRIPEIKQAAQFWAKNTNKGLMTNMAGDVSGDFSTRVAERTTCIKSVISSDIKYKSYLAIPATGKPVVVQSIIERIPGQDKTMDIDENAELPLNFWDDKNVTFL